MIEEYTFGKIVINGISYTDDIKIIQGRVVPVWWRRRGHMVEVDDIKDILKSNPGILVIGKGEPGMMKAAVSLRNFLQNNHIELIEETTPKAVAMFNRLRKEGKHISAGFHLSC